MNGHNSLHSKTLFGRRNFNLAVILFNGQLQYLDNWIEEFRISIHFLRLRWTMENDIIQWCST